MKLSSIVIGTALFAAGSCYGKQAYDGVRHWYAGQAKPDTSITREVQALKAKPAIVDAYIKTLSPEERQYLITKSTLLQNEYFMQKDTTH